MHGDPHCSLTRCYPCPLLHVCDFNLSLLLDEARQQSTSSAAANNPIWLAPEVLQGHPATAASDVYSFGLVRQPRLRPHGCDWLQVG